MTIVSICSDIHLEFGDITLPGGDILLLAGDTLVASSLREVASDAASRAQKKRYIRFCKEELSKYQRVLAIGGNHEHYGHPLEDTPELVKDLFSEFAPNATYLDNEFVEIEGVRFIGSTLWAASGYGTGNHMTIQGGLNDYTRIRTRGLDDQIALNESGHRRFYVADANRLHQEALGFLKEAVATDKPCVVMTHHAPTYLAINRKRFPEMDLDEAYASNQHAFIEANPQIKVWAFGHIHSRQRVQIGETRLVSNSRGYFGLDRSVKDFDATEADFDLKTFNFLV